MAMFYSGGIERRAKNKKNALARKRKLKAQGKKVRRYKPQKSIFEW